jgi:hypothetical protein
MSAADINRTAGQAPRRMACARCGATFECRPGGDCWCAAEPVRVALPDDGGDCLCRDCLRAAAQPKLTSA